MNEPLYRESLPFAQGFLQVDDVHRIFYEEFGNPAGIPAVYLHGGPGAGHFPYFHRFFDPAAFRVVVYDQRGAGRSLPFGETKNNSPDLLTQDLDALRHHLGIGRWHVFGGSWGSTLGLLYARAYASRVASLTLRGVFTMRKKELDFFYQGNRFFPAAFEKFSSFIPESERHDLIRAYYNRIASGDLAAARSWTRYESATCRLTPPTEEDLDKDAENMNFTLGMARLETHFFINHRFRPDDRILRGVNAIRHIPTYIVQGDADAVCPPDTARELKSLFPEAHLDMVHAGHSAREEAISSALVKAADRIRDHGSPLPVPSPQAFRPKPSGP